jgi:hypothetical protein
MLLLPLVQFQTSMFEVAPLEGLNAAEKPQFKKQDYLDLKWQESYSKFINDNFGFRSFFVRMINQVRFSLLNSTKAPGVVIGKQGQLFIESYIDEYIGRNFIGRSKIQETVRKIRVLQDSLKSRNKDLIVVFAPGKASFYPEYIPGRYMRKTKDSTNYKVYAELFSKQQVNFIDLNKWFVENKNKFKYPVYTKYGTHWNHYGMTLAFDSILKYIEKKRKLNLPDFEYGVVNYNSNLKGNDYDVGILMNLLNPIKKEAEPYPVYKFKVTRGAYKPNTLVVGDSYWWCLLGDDLPIRFFSYDDYWFYNRDLITRNNKTDNEVKNLNLSASLYDREVIILMATEATYYMFPYGFVDKAYALYCNDNSKRYNEIVAGMSNDREWYHAVVNKAIDHCIFVDEQIRKDAEYILSDEIVKTKEGIEKNIESIKKNEAWMADIKKKAKENGILEEEQIRKDAQWLLEQETKK